MKTDAFKWKESYSVGLSSVDKQHEKFLYLINELGDCIADKTYKEKGQQLFFALLHFADEYLLKEKMLANHIDGLDYSYFRVKHNEFLSKLREFKDNYNHEASEALFVDLYNYLKKLYPEFLSHYTPSLIKILKENGIE
jgi:hemerythrin-like metal-binding protein